MIKKSTPNPYFYKSINKASREVRLELKSIAAKHFSFQEMYDYFFTDVFKQEYTNMIQSQAQYKEQFKNFLFIEKTPQVNFSKQEKEGKYQIALIQMCKLQLMKMKFTTLEGRKERIKNYIQNHKKLYTIRFEQQNVCQGQKKQQLKSNIIFQNMLIQSQYPQLCTLTQYIKLILQNDKQQEFEIFRISLSKLLEQYNQKTKLIYPNLNPDSIYFNRKTKQYSLGIENPLLKALGLQYNPMTATDICNYRHERFTFDLYASHTELIDQMHIKPKEYFQKNIFQRYNNNSIYISEEYSQKNSKKNFITIVQQNQQLSQSWRYLNCLFYFNNGFAFLQTCNQANNIFQAIQIIQNLAHKINPKNQILVKKIKKIYVPQEEINQKIIIYQKRLLGKVQATKFNQKIIQNRIFQNQQMLKQKLKKYFYHVNQLKDVQKLLQKHYFSQKAQKMFDILSKMYNQIITQKQSQRNNYSFSKDVQKEKEKLKQINDFLRHHLSIEDLNKYQLQKIIEQLTQIKNWKKKISKKQQSSTIKKIQQMIINLQKQCKLTNKKILEDETIKLFQNKILSLSKIQEGNKVKFVCQQAYNIISTYRFNLTLTNFQQKKSTEGVCINKLISCVKKLNVQKVKISIQLIEIIIQLLPQDAFNKAIKYCLTGCLQKLNERQQFFNEKKQQQINKNYYSTISKIQQQKNYQKRNL